MAPCNSEPIVGATNGNKTSCHTWKSQDECTAATTSAYCVWCTDIELCSANGEECDDFVQAEGCSDENCTETDGEILETTVCDHDANCTEQADGGGGDGQQDACMFLSSESECLSSFDECVWCAEEEFCAFQLDTCSGGGQMTAGNNTVSCQSLETEANCTTAENCLWCGDQAKCRQESMGCPGNGVTGGANQDDHDRNSACFPIGNGTECVETGICFWCTEQDMCRPSFGDCPGNDGISTKPNLCLPLTNETDCLGSESCFWCADASLCRASEEECPGRGRVNICRDLIESVCDLGDGCIWWDQQSRCAPKRGLPTTDSGNFTDEDDASACPVFGDEGNCTMQFHCRWCLTDEKCQSAFDMCDDGTLGTRGNPCQQAAIQDACTEIVGCVWCAESSKCKKATIQGCELGEHNDGHGTLGNICIVQDLQIECEGLDGCQWCEAQSKCKANQTECGDPSGYVDLAFDENYGPAFQIRDGGLGTSDPYAVAVTLNFLYEVTAEGKTIEASLVDLESQIYTIKQSVGYFFGESTIESRKVQLEATIDGVGSIALDAYVMLNDGNITTPGTESWAVSVGDVKFNVELSNWTFCGDPAPCGDSNETSAYADLAFTIQGNSETPQHSDNNALVFNLGGNVPLLLSSEVEVDAFMRDMPEGFPRAESSTSQGTVFMFRFPKFAEGASYDPIIPYHYSLSVLKSELEPTIPPNVSAPTSVPKPPTAPPTTAPLAAPAPKPMTTDSGDNNYLSGGSIAGIIFGSLLGLCCCCAGIGYAASRKKGDENGYQAAADLDEKNNVTIDDEDFDDEAFRPRENRKKPRHRRRDEEEEVSSSDDEQDDEDDRKQGYRSRRSRGDSEISSSDSE